MFRKTNTSLKQQQNKNKPSRKTKKTSTKDKTKVMNLHRNGPLQILEVDQRDDELNILEEPVWREVFSWSSFNKCWDPACALFLLPTRLVIPTGLRLFIRLGVGCNLCRFSLKFDRFVGRWYYVFHSSLCLLPGVQRPPRPCLCSFPLCSPCFEINNESRVSHFCWKNKTQNTHQNKTKRLLSLFS